VPPSAFFKVPLFLHQIDPMQPSSVGGRGGGGGHVVFESVAAAETAAGVESVGRRSRISSSSSGDVVDVETRCCEGRRHGTSQAKIPYMLIFTLPEMMMMMMMWSMELRTPGSGCLLDVAVTTCRHWAAREYFLPIELKRRHTVSSSTKVPRPQDKFVLFCGLSVHPKRKRVSRFRGGKPLHRPEPNGRVKPMKADIVRSKKRDCLQIVTMIICAKSCIRVYIHVFAENCYNYDET
jgi:hypothetical protein